MPNLIGTGNNQVPTNGMLGGMAYQSPDSVVIKNLELTNLAGHNSLIPSDAVDVFVYDTRKDSDGGAWRYRTQNTSWYNETLNTATRGSRREFPAVAVIVATAAPTRKLYIYDGDDPDMPMWMIIASDDAQWPQAETTSPIYALNGIVVIGSSSNTQPTFATRNRLDLFHFISDKIEGSTNDANYCGVIQGIVNRNNVAVIFKYTGNNPYSLVNYRINDVTMTVLPNAPIDTSTGLPVPTIAVATIGGVSVIRDTGTIVNLRLINSYCVEFTKDYKLVANINTQSSTFSTHVYDLIPSSSTNTDGNRVYFRDGTGGGSIPPLSGNNVEATANETRVISGNRIAISCAGNSGNTIPALNILEEGSSQSSGMVAYVATNYNTGWMHGNIKGAWLSDTSITSVTGTELITNGTFATDVTGWTASTSTNTWSSGTMQITRSGGSGQATYQAFTTVAGQRYVATATVNSSGSRGDLYIINGTGWGGTQIGFTNGTNGQTRQLTVYFTATSTTTTLAFAVDQNGTSIIVDNVSVRREEADRSVNNQGLAVYGTITKTPVATGADLVAYSGFSASNYLQQPYNSALDFGTNPFSVMVWFKTPTGGTGTEVLFSWRDLVGSNPMWQVYLNGTSNIAFDFQGTQNGGSTFSNTLRDNTWHLLTAVQRSASLREFYIDSILVATNTTTLSPGFILANSVLKVGVHYDNNYAYTGSLSLLRISASAPSADQIRKIYEDEKVLFRENAKATLYGSSNAPSALAYDDTTRLLHVGTSSGRSDFQGLRRINNTTTAVTTAISASNGLIAEQ